MEFGEKGAWKCKCFGVALGFVQDFRLRKCTNGDKQLQIKERDHFEQRTLSKKSNETLVGWLKRQQYRLYSFF